MTETKAIEAGRYDAVVTQSRLGVTSNGSDQIAIAVQIDEEPFKGKTFVYYGYFTDGALQYTLDALRACGWEGDDFESLDKETESPIAGKPVSIVLDWEEWEGNRRLRVQWVNARGGGMVKERMPDEKKVSLGRQIEALMKGKSSAQAKQPEKNEVDDTPF